MKMTDDKVCCERFATECGTLQAPMGGGLAYPPSVGEAQTGQVERQDDGTYAVWGCCGGGCYVLTDMRFCPWCGSALK